MPDIFTTPTMDEHLFLYLLLQHHSPVNGHDSYQILTWKNVNPAFALAQFTLESGCGLVGKGSLNRNWGNLRSGSRQSGSRGGMAIYDDWIPGLLDYCDLVHSYLDIHDVKTLAQFVSRYAPGSENDTGAYIQFMADYLLNHANLFPASVIETWPSMGGAVRGK